MWRKSVGFVCAVSVWYQSVGFVCDVSVCHEFVVLVCAILCHIDVEVALFITKAAVNLYRPPIV